MEFIYDEEKLKENYNNISLYGPIFYPMKANTNTMVINTLYELYRNTEGLYTKNKFLISNMLHYEKLKKLNIPEDYIGLMNPLLSDDEIKRLYDSNVRFFVFDNIKKYKTFIKYANLQDTIIIFKLSIESIYPGIHSNLGINKKELEDILKSNHLICRDKTHIGISIYFNQEVKDKYPNSQYIRKAINYINKLKYINELNFLEIGGLIDIKNDIQYFNNVCNKNGLKIILEPGRELLQDVMISKTDIIRIANSNITLKDGIYTGMLDCILYKKKFDIDIIFNNTIYPLYRTRQSTEQIEVHLFGGSADSADKLGIYYINNKDYKELIITPVKLLSAIIRNTGSYFEEFITTYNGEIKSITTMKGKSYEI